MYVLTEPDQPFYDTIARIRQAVGGPEEEISKCIYKWKLVLYCDLLHLTIVC